MNCVSKIGYNKFNHLLQAWLHLFELLCNCMYLYLTLYCLCERSSLTNHSISNIWDIGTRTGTKLIIVTYYLKVWSLCSQLLEALASLDPGIPVTQSVSQSHFWSVVSWKTLQEFLGNTKYSKTMLTKNNIK